MDLYDLFNNINPDAPGLEEKVQKVRKFADALGETELAKAIEMLEYVSFRLEAKKFLKGAS